MCKKVSQRVCWNTLSVPSIEIQEEIRSSLTEVIHFTERVLGRRRLHLLDYWVEVLKDLSPRKWHCLTKRSLEFTDTPYFHCTYSHRPVHILLPLIRRIYCWFVLWTKECNSCETLGWSRSVTKYRGPYSPSSKSPVVISWTGGTLEDPFEIIFGSSGFLPCHEIVTLP